jgi:hypothetical protein
LANNIRQFGVEARAGDRLWQGDFMSDDFDWAFANRDDAKAEIRAAVGYLLKHASDGDRGDIVREIAEIVHRVAQGLPPS